MTPEQKALRDAYLAEMWKPCPELSRGERAAKREADRAEQREIEDRAISTARPHIADVA